MASRYCYCMFVRLCLRRRCVREFVSACDCVWARVLNWLFHDISKNTRHLCVETATDDIAAISPSPSAPVFLFVLNASHLLRRYREVVVFELRSRQRIFMCFPSPFVTRSGNDMRKRLRPMRTYVCFSVYDGLHRTGIYTEFHGPFNGIFQNNFRANGSFI